MALFAGNVQEKLKPVARLVILFDSSLKFCGFFTPWLIVSGSKKEKAQACCKIGDFSDSSFKFYVFFHPVSRLMILFDSFVCVFTP